MKYFAFALLLAACSPEATNAKQTPPLPIPKGVLPPILENATEPQYSKHLNATTVTVTLPDGTIVMHEYCTTLSGDAKVDCTDLLHAISACVKQTDEPREKCEAASISDYLALTNDDGDDDEYPPMPEEVSPSSLR